MFRGRKKVVPNWSRRPTSLSAEADRAVSQDSDDQSVIDAVLGQARDVRSKLGRDDRHRLESYLESVRSVERRIRLTELIRREEDIDEKDPGPSELALPKEMPADAAAFTGEVYKMELDGTIVGKFGRAGKAPKEFGIVNAIDCRSENELFIGELANWRVQKVTLRASAR